MGGTLPTYIMSYFVILKIVFEKLTKSYPFIFIK